MKIAISGGGVAGNCLAYWLAKAGHTVTVIEIAPAFRSGGYMIDFWGTGYEVCRRMGLEAEVQALGYKVETLQLVDPSGRPLVRLGVERLRHILNDQFTSLPRGDLAQVLFDSVRQDIEVLFGSQIASVENGQDAVTLTLSTGATRSFDLLVGADGLHSAVRRLAFGPMEQVEKQLGYRVAAAELPGYRPRDERTYVIFNRPSRQIARFALRDDRTAILCVFRADLLSEQGMSDNDPLRALTEIYGKAGWECSEILSALSRAPSLYYDNVSQIVMKSWSTGRIVLLGDAAACVSLLAGEGSGLAMTEAYILAGELQRAKGDHQVALAAYEEKLRDLLASKQRSALGFASWMAPRSSLGLWLRNQLTRAMAWAPATDFVMKRMLKDDITLPDYAL